VLSSETCDQPAMDLSDLRTSLFLRDIRVPERVENGELSVRGTNVALEIIGKHKRREPSVEDKLVVVVMESVLETLEHEKLEPSATAVFAALCSCLEKSNEASLSSACCHALFATLPRVPPGILRLKCSECVKVVMKHTNEVAESTIPCLGLLVAASGADDWAAILPAYSFILSLVVIEDPKLRKKSQVALIDIFKAFSREQALVGVLHAAGEALTEFSGLILSGPGKTAQEAARASNKERRKAEDKIRMAVSNALRLMGALKQVICLLPDSVAQKLCSQILSLFHLQQVLLTTSATEILLSLTSVAKPETLDEILKALLSINALWTTEDATLLISIIKLFESLTLNIRNGAYISSVFHLLVPQLASRTEGVARAAANAMIHIAKVGIDEDIISAAPCKESRAAPIMSIISAVESSFGAQYYDSWELCLAVAQELISSIGRGGSTLASGLVKKIGELCAGVDDVIAASDSVESARITDIAQKTLGVCIQSLGPETVFEHLPLEIEEALDGCAEGRTWMIPLLKTYMKGGRLKFWISEIFPLICSLEARASQSADSHSRLKNTLIALELQLWSTLPSFASWADDIPDCFGYVNIDFCFESTDLIVACKWGRLLR
jgi:hypothetical protein